MTKKYGEWEEELMPPKLAFGVIMVCLGIKDWEGLVMPMGTSEGLKSLLKTEGLGVEKSVEDGLGVFPPRGFFNLAWKFSTAILVSTKWSNNSCQQFQFC